MKISTKGRYALRLMLDLASNDSGTPIRLKDVAKRQGISEKYLEQKTAQTLGVVDGAGKVTVMITLKSTGQKVVEKDQQSTELD